MEKVGGVLREGVRTRAVSGDTPYVVFEISRTGFATGPLAEDGESDG